MLSTKSLKRFGCRRSSDSKQLVQMDCSREKKAMRCSGNSAKSLLIISSVGSKTASRMGEMYFPTSGSLNVTTMLEVRVRTSGSRAWGAFCL